jgi:hypothetical protein
LENHVRKQPIAHNLLLLSCAFFLMSCGGGGGSSQVEQSLTSTSASSGTASLPASSGTANPPTSSGTANPPTSSGTANPPTSSGTANPPASSGTAKVSYSASNAVITNPERGFYYMVDCTVPLRLSELQSYRSADGHSLAMCLFLLNDATASPISQSTLDLFQQQMDTLRTAGMKTVLRYNNNGSDVDASPAMAATHLTQLAPYLDKNKDVIAVVQAGFIGGWGEWGDSQNFGTYNTLSAQNWADRKALAEKLLQALPAERMAQMRDPDAKRHIVGNAALAASEAFNGSNKARLGHHNDCFLSSSTDLGTYTNAAVDYPYLAAETTYLPMGGESCRYNPPRSDCPTALAELSRFHWSYMNEGFNQTVLDNWKSQGCFTQIKQKIGYRFVLQNGAYSSSAKPGGSLNVSFTLENQGWAAPFNSRDVELVLRNTASGALYRFKLAADPRQWLAGQTVTVNQTMTLPAGMPNGNYAALLNLPDPMPSLRSRADYAIQLANTGLWEANTGFNSLNHTVSIAP